METTENIQDEECDVESVGEALIEGFTEILEMKKKGVEFQDAKKFLNSL